MTFVSYAQNFEDVLLWRALRDIGKGFYIDVGAAHPDVDSVTRAFYDRGWSGINVEPVPSFARRLRAARARDLTLELALGETDGRTELLVVEGTGLSTTSRDAGEGYERAGYDVSAVEVPVATLASVCREHAPGAIHFLKIDVEGGERAVLAGADLGAFRPWIVLVEATAPLSSAETHAEWEEILLAADYRFVWFDGLNRFYVAAERADALAPHFRAPPNVFDDFLRAADTEWARRITEAEGRAAALAEQLARAELGRRVAREQADRAALLLAREAARAADMKARFEAADSRGLLAMAERQADSIRELVEQNRRLGEQANAANAWLASIQASTSWRLTAPLRRAALIAKRERGIPAPAEPPAIEQALEKRAEPGTPAQPRPEARATRTVHQFHSGAAPQDAITNAMLLMRRVLRELGYRSEIFVEHRDPALADEMHLLADIPPHGGYVLIVRHSMGHDQLDRILSLTCRKILLYHNITPPELLEHSPHQQEYARLGREQLARLKPHVASALADSEYNALELRRLGFDPVQACPMLVNVAALGRHVRAARDAGAPFTVLFVGRITELKNQLGLIESFALFRTAFGRPARLVLVGKFREGEAYLERLFAAIRRLGLDGEVLITGHIGDAERDAWYDAADLYLSLSRHEGFGVPLLEAMARGVPVLAWPAGAVGETLGDGAELLTDTVPSAAADRMLSLARDPDRRARLAEAGARSLQRFALDRHKPRLVEALLRAGAAPLPDPDARRALSASMRFAVTGHVRGTYSLAAINRALASAIEAELPGTVRLLPVEGEPVVDLTGVPDEQRPLAVTLAGRPAPATGPEIVISQHYPVYEPPNPGDLPLALFFWEESVVPAATVDRLNASFRGVLAPSRFVAKVLVDSGVVRPVRVLGQAPPLGPFRELARERAAPDGGVTTFLHVSSCFPRKGVDALLAAYARAFRRGDPVRLVIKGFPNPHNDVAEQIAALRARDPDVAEIRFINEDLREAALLGLYRDASAVVLPTRGEGYNLPGAEALAACVPLIVTAYGGHRDFCGPDEARLVDYTFAGSKSHLASAGSVAVDPDIADLAAALAEHVARPDQARTRAERGAARILAETDPAALVRRLADIALDLLLAPPPVRLRIAWISTWDVRCGVSEYSRHLLDHLPSDGLAGTVVLADTRSAEREGGADVRVRPVWRIGDPAGIGALASALTREDPHAVVLQHQPGLIRWELLARLLDGEIRAGRIVVTVLHNTRDLLLADEAHRLAALAALGRIARVVVHTVADLNLMKRLGLTANVTMLPHGTEAPLPPCPARPLERSDGVLIGSYGFLLPGKGLPQLIEALALLRRRWPAARLRLVNARYDAPDSDDELAACRDAAAAAGIEDAVEFITDFLPHERSMELLRECDVVVLPYQASLEASSAAVRTALTAGVAVAVTPLPLFEEAEDAVFRLPGMEPDAIAAGLETLLADPVARDAVVRAAQAWTGEREWSGIGRRFAGMLRGLVAERTD